MFVIGELINGMYRKIARAIAERDKAVIQKCARQQVEAGVDALDINYGPGSKSPLEDMCWLVETVQEVTDKPLSLDSSKPAVMEAALKSARNRTIINSTTADTDKLEVLVPLAKRYRSQLIGIAISSKGIPQTRDQRVELAAQIVAFCAQQDFPMEDLYLDPILLPINVAQPQMTQILQSISDFKLIATPSPKTLIGLSNISQGAKSRRLINRVFLVMAMASGLDAAIIDPLDNELVDSLAAAQLILNRNIYCDAFTEAFRRR